jgi:type III pantothenate kinase
MKILIDVGNQRLKWLTSDQINGFEKLSKNNLPRINESRISQVIDIRDDHFIALFENQIKGMETPESVWVSAVSAESVQVELNALCFNQWGVSPNYIKSSEFAMGVQNGYVQADCLGVDRWAAMIAAYQLVLSQPVVIVDAGTAVTVDYLDISGNHKGGMIFPGISTMIESLNVTTGRISGVVTPTDKVIIGLENTNTQSAVENGVMWTVVSAIDCAIDRYLSAGVESPRLIITGGDAELIASLSKYTIQLEQDLVLKGVFLLSGETL